MTRLALLALLLIASCAPTLEANNEAVIVTRDGNTYLVMPGPAEWVLVGLRGVEGADADGWTRVYLEHGPYTSPVLLSPGTATDGVGVVQGVGERVTWCVRLEHSPPCDLGG